MERLFFYVCIGDWQYRRGPAGSFCTLQGGGSYPRLFSEERVSSGCVWFLVWPQGKVKEVAENSLLTPPPSPWPRPIYLEHPSGKHLFCWLYLSRVSVLFYVQHKRSINKNFQVKISVVINITVLFWVELHTTDRYRIAIIWLRNSAIRFCCGCIDILYMF